MQYELTAEEKIKRGIIRLHKPQPFFAHLIMNLKPREMPEDFPAGARTMAVDAEGKLYYDKEWTEKLDQRYMAGVLCHETLHVALLHLLMADVSTRNQTICNIAQDIVINMMVSKAGMDLPMQSQSNKDGGVPVDIGTDTSEFDLGKGKDKVHIKIEDVTEKTWHEVYAEIIEQIKQQGKEPNSYGSKDRIGWDNHLRGKSDSGKEKKLSQKEVKKLRQKWQQKLAEASQYAKQQGKLPAGMERHVEDLLEPKIKWSELLLKYLKPHINPVDWSYSRPHKKSQVLGVYLPNTLKESAEISVVVDTSGSIRKDELEEFYSEMNSILKSMQNIKMTVYFADTQINSEHELDGEDTQKLMSLTPEGGGGTDMEYALEQIKEKNPQTPVVVVLTDGYTNFNNKAMDYPFDVIWVVNQNGVPLNEIPYGNKVKMEV